MNMRTERRNGGMYPTLVVDPNDLREIQKKAQDVLLPAATTDDLKEAYKMLVALQNHFFLNQLDLPFEISLSTYPGQK